MSNEVVCYALRFKSLPGTLRQVKLCRFELLDNPGLIRSGVYHDQRIFETDGRTPDGIHDQASVRLFQPLGACPSVRIYDQWHGQSGESDLLHSYINPTTITGPNSELEIPPADTDWDFEARICAVISDRGSQIDRAEAPEFILGWTMMISLVATDDDARALKMGAPQAWARDAGVFVGPFLVTPDELGGVEKLDQTSFRWEYEMKVNEDVIVKGIHDPKVSMADLIERASSRHEVVPGELFALPPLEKPPLDFTELGRPLLPSDRVILVAGPLGALTANFV